MPLGLQPPLPLLEGVFFVGCPRGGGVFPWGGFDPPPPDQNYYLFKKKFTNLHVCDFLTIFEEDENIFKTSKTSETTTQVGNCMFFIEKLKTRLPHEIGRPTKTIVPNYALAPTCWAKGLFSRDYICLLFYFGIFADNGNKFKTSETPETTKNVRFGRFLIEPVDGK